MSNFVFLAAKLKGLSACSIEFSHLRVETAQCVIRSCISKMILFLKQTATPNVDKFIVPGAFGSCC